MGQNENNEIENNSVSTDSTIYKLKYGLRLGFDISKIVRTAIDDEYSGFEINADFRLTKKLFIAAEVGNEERTTTTDFLNSTADGSYIKAGVDYNLYTNWLGADDLIYSGFRIGYSTFNQTINSFTVFNRNQSFEQGTFTTPIEIDGLDAIWGELIMGIKAEVLPNLYMGVNVQFKLLANETEPDNFENVYIPGFNRTFDSGSFGIGFGYNIAYLIPFKKK